MVAAQQKLAQKNLQIALFPFFCWRGVHSQGLQAPGFGRKVGHHGGKIWQACARRTRLGRIGGDHSSGIIRRALAAGHVGQGDICIWPRKLRAKGHAQL